MLLLRNNRIGDEGAKHLAWMLELNCFLEELGRAAPVVTLWAAEQGKFFFPPGTKQVF